MTKHFIYLLILALVISCGQNNNQQQEKGNSASDSLAVVNDPKNNLNIQTNSFSEIDSSGVLMFPLSMGETEREGGSLSYKEMPNHGYWNIIFYNSKTKEYYLLSERKMIVGNYDYKFGSDDNDNISQTTNHIFYTVRTDDFNKDKKLTDQDPQYLFISDKFGNNFRQISPTNYNLNNWRYIKSSDKVIMTVGKDSDNNLEFDNSDEITTFEIELDKGTEAKEVFGDDFKNKLKILFDRDWKRLKK
ncbi:hypothetical protein [Pedobacter xixiisoli]|uniref:Lipoprotein n=1 Tax=Pedobacter xixiisoli TaxID=1476464 RepID=A0A285ZQE9_9SPHI|nr:hypothetical protein [Pedobacter xixiisoli]SOD11877.1 hypothetical protein SAMN06297358_0379 [Pedobacter xixiisoli]